MSFRDHWSCSKFADLLRGTPKLSTGTAEEWNTWERKAKAKNFRYWLAEEGLDYLQSFIYWPINRMNDMRCYIHNRWFFKTHALTSNLKRGQWHEFDTRLLHAVFDELVDFVEIEEAWMHVMCSDEERKKYKTPWYRTVFRIGSWRCAEAGINHLRWAAGLKSDGDWIDKKNSDYGQPTSQALAAQEILTIYTWWKDERPKRPNPMDASGWSQYCEEKRQTAIDRNTNPLWSNFITTEGEKEYSRKILDNCHKIEIEQEDEDTAMLIRLVRIRQNLWT